MVVKIAENLMQPILSCYITYIFWGGGLTAQDLQCIIIQHSINAIKHLATTSKLS